ncbi:hypothetical protein DDZ14_19110 [Maritimibacter sp. 55A14]|uniref:helix-turn-helix domain-containing protein n=1 Tax=Maritimibacter sp. 55A14 TaxID=2174844 RepID=UPI000D61FFD7|nr:helix-turn-helix transcriptional regulator [Maritimibacter sp. 55A14]PWE28375.1 hypothetical protein DDZ14_19110 [Maritimibacter sp. 55A14]
MNNSTRKSPTADLMKMAIGVSGKSQREIAQEAGFEKQNVISMMKNAEMKIPIDRIPALAEACDTDPLPILRSAMEEYHGAAWKVLVDAFGEPLKQEERDVLDLFRIANDGHMITIHSELADMLLTLFMLMRE